MPTALDRQGHKHEAYAAEDQNGCRQRFPMTFESRRSPLPVVTHTLSPQNPGESLPYLGEEKQRSGESTHLAGGFVVTTISGVIPAEGR